MENVKTDITFLDWETLLVPWVWCLVGTRHQHPPAERVVHYSRQSISGGIRGTTGRILLAESPQRLEVKQRDHWWYPLSYCFITTATTSPTIHSIAFVLWHSWTITHKLMGKTVYVCMAYLFQHDHRFIFIDPRQAYAIKYANEC